MDDSLMSEPQVVENPQYKWLVKLGYGELVCVFTRLRISNYYLKTILKERDKADEDRSGTISIQEFFTRYELTFLTPLAKRAFAAFDLDGSGELDFGEFSISLWNFCTMPLRGLAHFFFEIYDADKSGQIDDSEFGNLMIEAYGGESHMSNFNVQLLKSMKRKKLKFSVDEFCDFVQANPTTFWPVLTLQKELRFAICGQAFWERVTRERLMTGSPASRTLRFLKECFDPSGYVDSFDLRINYAKNLHGYVIKGASEDERVSNSYLNIKINGLPLLEMDSKAYPLEKSPQYRLWYSYTDLHIDDRITWEIWHWKLPFELGKKKPKPILSKPLGTGTFTLRDCFNLEKRAKVSFPVNKLKGITNYNCTINFSFEFSLRAPLKDFSKEEAVVSIGSGQRRQAKVVKRGQVIPQTAIEEFKIQQNRDKQSWRRIEKAKQEAAVADLQSKGSTLEAELLAFRGGTSVDALSNADEELDIEDLLAGGLGSRRRKPRAGSTGSKKKKAVTSLAGVTRTGPPRRMNKMRPLH